MLKCTKVAVVARQQGAADVTDIEDASNVRASCLALTVNHQLRLCLPALPYASTNPLISRPLPPSMALVDYGSDSGSDAEDNNAPSPLPPAIRPAATPAAARLKTEATASGPAVTLSKTKPALSSYAALAAVPLPPPKNRGIHKRAAKFTLEAASSIPESATESTAASGPENPPPAKKPKLGSGSSSLLGMLPPPKQALPKAKPMPAPVRLKPLQVSADGRIENFGMAMGMESIDRVEDEPVPIDFSRKVVTKAATGDADDEGEKKETKIVRPLDLKGKGKVATIIPPPGATGAPTKAVMPVMDFFGIGGESNSSRVCLHGLFC